MIKLLVISKTTLFEKGNILHENIALRNLAYEINKNKKGHYNMLIIEIMADKISEYERRLRLHEDIVRFMTIKIKKYEEKNSIMLDNQSE